MTVAAQPPVLAARARIAGDYEVVALLHRSRLLDVYDVYSVSRDCRCVAKVPRPDCAQDERTRRRLSDEGRLLLGFTHPHVVRAYELIEEPDPVLVLETLPGETVARVLERAAQPALAGELAQLGRQLCSALHYLHGRGILHLDLKPANIVLDRGLAKLIDLSIARPPGPVGPGLGSRRYAAPEQARGGDVGPAADVWGAGCVLYEAATGRPAFDARGDAWEQLERRARPLAEARSRSRLPRALVSAIDAALDPDPDARPALGELTEALHRAFAARR